MMLLAFDCSAAACSAAVRHDGSTVAREWRAMERGHAEALVPLIEATLGQAGARFEDISAVATTVGPGSFTGVRIGLATARGLSLALGAPVVGVTTFEAVALAARRACGSPHLPCLVVLDAKRADVYVQLLPPGGEPSGPAVAASPSAAAAMLPPGRAIVAGDGASQLRPFVEGRELLFASGPGVADAADVAELAERRLREDGAGRLVRPMPVYVTPPGVTLRPRRTAAVS
jgi:tRNA threonylcarbamoyladenosine biosynthesis protein TsaB